MEPMKPMLAFDPSMAHEVVAGESQREYLGRLLAPIPTNGTWAMEPKLDGIRWQVLIEEIGPHEGDRWTHVRSIGGRNLKEHKTPPHLAEALATLPEGTILDGELMAGDCSSDVGSLAQRGKQVYVVFDVLAFAGKDVTRHPWSARRELPRRAVRVGGGRSRRRGVQAPRRAVQQRRAAAVGLREDQAEADDGRDRARLGVGRGQEQPRALRRAEGGARRDRADDDGRVRRATGEGEREGGAPHRVAALRVAEERVGAPPGLRADARRPGELSELARISHPVEYGQVAPGRAVR
jgi:hypothetical protein